MGYTTIQIKRKTRERIKNHKITELETYDEIINRLITHFEKSQSENKSGDPSPDQIPEHTSQKKEVALSTQ